MSAAWASASTYRDSDKRGGANGARIRLAPQIEWEVNNPPELRATLATLEELRARFNASGTTVSMADLIVLGGCAAIESAARSAGHEVIVPFRPGRTDATQDQTDVESFAPLEPRSDGFRNFLGKDADRNPEESMDDKAQLLTLSAPEMTVLVGGMRALNANADGSKHGVLADQPETLTNDLVVHLLDRNIEWSPVSGSDGLFELRDRASGDVRWTATRCDLMFGSNSQQRAIAEEYGADDARQKFVTDFVAAWDKVMSLDRFDLR